MLAQFTAWLLELVQQGLTALLDVLGDAFVTLADVVLGALVALLSAIPVPAFLSNGLQSLWSQLDSGIMYFAVLAGVPQAFAMLGVAYLFRLARKAVTLFQW